MSSEHASAVPPSIHRSVPEKLAGAQRINPAYAVMDRKYELSAAQRRGRDTWYLWTGYDESLWRRMPILSQQGLGFRLDLLQILEARYFPRAQRWESLGVINDPLCEPANEPDSHGLWLGRCESEGVAGIPGEPSGIVGLRKLPNPDFDPRLWSREAYWRDPTAEPPYLIGIACGLCHIAFDPMHPPDDPQRPTWEDLAGTPVNLIANIDFEQGDWRTLLPGLIALLEGQTPEELISNYDLVENEVTPMSAPTYRTGARPHSSSS